MKQILIFVVVFLFSEAKYVIVVNDDLVDETARKERDVGPKKLDELAQAEAKIAYIESYDDGGDGENQRGYYKASEDKGSNGYKHYDSFHKKDGDKYGYETHSAFGKALGDETDSNGKYENTDGQFKDKQVEEKKPKNAYKVVDDEGDGNDYTQGNASGYSEKYVAEDEDSGDGSEHYEVDDSKEYGNGNYESQGNLIHNGGNSPYTYDGETNTDSEHYTAADYEEDY
ncbi:hypothetical protein RN001_004227 [Aquatica leii]|uniref:Uncharacterized protein n=1 Tax=Aquatica leii TaxID=1421715 RepID=A0AAN7QJE6_9COLE|nr:hypothetical protein RN001_004227 [Aquatica leii]